jgi:TolB-like protein/Tfp pilus assembly protein PilF
MLRLRVLGPFEVRWSDGEPVDLTTRKAQSLLAYLAVENGRSHTRDQLSTLLWADMADERSRHNLRQTLAKIRRCCDSLVLASGDCLAINLDACAVDVVEFEQLAKREDPDALRRCLDLYRGDLLEGVVPREPVFDEWLLLARGRMRKMACQVAGRLAAVLREQGRVDECIQALNDMLTIDSAHEPAHRELMKLLALNGRRTDALRQYQTCVDALKRELGAEPSPETKKFYASLQKTEVEPARQISSDAATAPAQAGADRPSVAVLPFDNLSAERDAYFVDGIVEDLITALSRFHSLVVIARGSSFAFRDRDLTDQDIARELGAQFLVRGSVQRAADRVRINVQLLDAAAGLTVWADRFDREMEDVFLLQDEITSTLVSTLAGRVEAARLAHARKAPAERLNAYDYVLRGKDHHHRFTAKDCAACIEMFEHAIERDPSYAVAYAWLGCGLGQAMVFCLDDIPTLVDRCKRACEHGLELDENESECHRVLAQVNLTRGNLERSMWHQERALFLNPNDDRSVCSMGEILAFMGRAREAEEWVRRSMRLNPYHSPRYWTHLGRALFHQGRYRDSQAAFDKVGKARKDDLAYRLAASVLLGDRKAVGRTAKELRERFPDFDPVKFVGHLPYERQQDREALLEPLTAGFGDAA